MRRGFGVSQKVDGSRATKALAALPGYDAVVKVYNGAPHGFIQYPPGSIPAVQQGLDDTTEFVKARIPK